MKTETTAAARAIGADDGCSLILQNARARVEVVCMENAVLARDYVVRGDVPPNLRSRELHSTAAAAVAFALECLAEYNR